MKFAGAHGVAAHLAAAMAEVIPGSEADVITWVPLSRRRRSRRGFDQAEVLARALGKRMRLPAGRLLVRTRDEPSQARRAGVDRRRAALRGAFRLSRRVPARRVLLVDDVLTTGSTAAACAGVLKGGGTEHVTLVTAARSLGGPVPARCRGVATPGGARVP
jgi:ComF family protein